MKKTLWALATFLTFSFVNVLHAEVIVQPPDLEPGDQYRLIFTTSQRRDATSRDIDVYNDFVQSAADSSPQLAALGIEWRVMAQTPAVSLRDNSMTRFDEQDLGLPVYRVDGQLFVPRLPLFLGYYWLNFESRSQRIR